MFYNSFIIHIPGYNEFVFVFWQINDNYFTVIPYCVGHDQSSDSYDVIISICIVLVAFKCLTNFNLTLISIYL